MKTFFDCIPCFVRQALDSGRRATDDDTIHEQVLRGTLRAISEMDLRGTPPAMGYKIHRLIRELVGESDPYREMKDTDTTIARVRYFGRDLPMAFALCLRMRQKNISNVSLDGKNIDFETFKDRCSTFVHIPLVMERAGVLEVTIKHPVS